MSDAAFAAAYREVGEEFHVKAHDWPLNLLERYVVLHVRGTDKRAAPGRSFCTETVLEHLLTFGLDVVAVSDDAEMLDGFLARRPWLLTPRRTTPRASPSWRGSCETSPS